MVIAGVLIVAYLEGQEATDRAMGEGASDIISRVTLNIGTMTRAQYAGIFYHALTEEIMPGLEALGFDAQHAWANARNSNHSKPATKSWATARPS